VHVLAVAGLVVAIRRFHRGAGQPPRSETPDVFIMKWDDTKHDEGIGSLMKKHKK
jgi:hypothetical protein